MPPPRRPSLPRRFPRAPRWFRPERDDFLIAGTGLVGGVFAWAVGLQGDWPDVHLPGWVALVPLAVISAAELLRRTAPRAALAVGTAALVADSTVGTLVPTVLMFTDLIYAGVVYAERPFARRLPLATLSVTLVSTFVPVVILRSADSLLLGLSVGLITVAPAFTGVIVRDHRDEAAAERLRAEQTALLAEMDRTQAVNAERARMARELHDMVANHLSAIAIHSTAALSLPEGPEGHGDPSATRDALGVIRENSVQGLTEMRRLIGLLRAAEGPEDAAAVASPTLDGLDALLTRARGTAAPGFTFTLVDERVGADDGGDGPRSLPTPVELAAYRVVQESLTNALKHASPGAVTVRLTLPDGDGGPLVVRVTSPLGGAAVPAGPRAPGSGAGLVGMRERVELLRGTLSAGPADAAYGGAHWEVRAELPLAEP
ncbi:histidine kinase [Streptomyces sp. Z26]|uniref:sensor histidine kinase n=1 Tax=Streptomyces TaxID=1883 RepID=UPI000EF15120|nr:histidine kinase [Streptomyces sp. Z26]RLL68928.1 two-component sensor histidine kinase [Streptomyces sp. Z26]